MIDASHAGSGQLVQIASDADKTSAALLPSSCELCGGAWQQVGEEHAPGNIGRAVKAETFPLLRCARCRSLKLVLPPSLVRAYLESSDYNNPESDAKTWPVRRPYLSWIVDRFLADLPRSTVTTIVDFGASFGHLGRVLHDYGYSAIGVEVNERARAVATTTQPALTTVADVAALAARAGTIDAVVAIDSLYYLESPCAMLQCFARLLRPGGRLVMRNTSGEFRWLMRRVLRRRGSMTGALGDACWAFTAAGSAAAVRSVGLELSGVHRWERRQGSGLRGLYYECAGLTAVASGGLLPVSPGCVITAVKPQE